MHALKELPLPRAIYSGEIALLGFRPCVRGNAISCCACCCHSCQNKKFLHFYCEQRDGLTCLPAMISPPILIVAQIARAVFLVCLAAYAHKKRVNMSALGIGVDFLQIMSIFTSFGFKWPVTLKALFQYTSLSTFNDQMMAPECTVSVWTFTNKCVTPNSNFSWC